MNYDRERGQAAPEPGLRLLPWETPEGKPCFLRTDNSESLLSRVADDLEEAQLRTGAEVLADAETVLADRAAGPLTLRIALGRTSTALGNAIRVADSRATRPTPNG
ncbi:hypothetical protein [Streptomyces johnsoniae]|uniref:Uncharacterized protein n=1 Tax=Streptomyces johnsoniae TaxID=3075532 RepID=A0ABU2S3M8_9ACTN|nr:hypothetical protein [Streptomyces sp. DSM 41886]MDT0443593.1 hypothetical protein [Streptomyces sp. DSM 41886]